MFDGIRDIFKKKESPVDRIRIDEVPGMIDKYAEDLDSEIRAGTSVHMKAVMDSRSNLIVLIQTLSSAEREEAFHPKLEKIARNTLPLFEKSMIAALSRELPGEPDEFYQAATECLKGCVKSQAGPGRYLQGVFPDEMKAIRKEIDVVGREMNIMTPVISAARKKRELIRSCRDIYSTLTDQIGEKESSATKIPLLESDLLERRRVLEQASADLSRVMEGEGAKKLQDLRRKEQSAAEEVAAIERRMRAIFSNITHVFRKAEKIMQRAENGRAPKELRQSVELLSGRDIPREQDLRQNLGAVLGIVGSMINSGDIVLKNREEKDLFADPSEINRILSDLYTRQRETEKHRFSIAEQYRGDPARARITDFERKIKDMERHIRELEEQQQALEETASKADSLIPELTRKLESGLGSLSGKEIVLESVSASTES
ncbi:MAG: hypothetical protein APR55_10465 [Methanolinea sp. SDB]|nr:MAG: hypothetical protein APR55_10465 [Methanolinea sp. SDB]